MSGPLPQSVRVIERNWLSSNIIVFDNDQSVTVVDTGYGKHALINAALIDAARGPKPVAQIINTHLHSDHCGGNAALALRHACDVLVPAASYEAAMNWDRKALTFDATGQRCDRFVPGGLIESGQTLPLGGLRWQVFSAPGHDPNSMVFFEPTQRILISADALWEDGFGVIFPELSGESGFAEQAAMIELIEDLAPAWVIPGHGAPFNGVAPALSRARSRLDYLRGNPVKHAQYAIKVLVRFLMLELESATEGQIIARLGAGSIVQDTALLLGLGAEESIRWAIEQLLKGGQLARNEAGTLVSR